MSDKVYTQIPPSPAPQSAEDSHAQLSASEQEKYHEVLDYFSKDAYALPNVERDAQLTEEEKFWLSRECMLRYAHCALVSSKRIQTTTGRYLRASKWKTQTAIERLENTLRWRRDFGLYELLTPQHVEPEAVTGKEIVYGYDTEGRPGLYMFPSRQNTDEPTRQIQYAVWMLERGVDLMRPGVESVTFLVFLVITN